MPLIFVLKLTMCYIFNISYTQIYSHRAFYHPFYKTVQAYISYADIEQNPIYLYKFAYKGNYSYSVLFTGTTKDYGVGHCDDLIYLFNSPAIFPKGLSEGSLDETMKNILVRTYVTFAISGKPKEFTAIPACKKDTFYPICPYQKFSNSPDGKIQIDTSQDYDMAAVRLWDKLKEY